MALSFQSTLLEVGMIPELSTVRILVFYSVRMCTICMPDACGGQRRASDSLGLEL